jgi:hypothetical protein
MRWRDTDYASRQQTKREMETNQKPPGTIRVLPKHILESLKYANPASPANRPIALALADILEEGTLSVEFDGMSIRRRIGENHVMPSPPQKLCCQVLSKRKLPPSVAAHKRRQSHC